MKCALRCVVLLFISVIALISCKDRNNNGKPNDIMSDSVSLTKKYYLDNDSTKPYCYLDINYVFPREYADTAILHSLQQQLNSAIFEDESYEGLSAKDAISKYTDDYISNYKQEIALYKSHIDDADEIDNTFFFSKKLSNKILFNQDMLIAYQIKAVDSRNNTDTITSLRNVVFDLKTGKTVTEKDIFADGYKKPLNAMIVKKVLELNNAQKPDDLFEIGYWGIEDMSSNDNFYVDTNGITYIFNQGEYAAPRIGSIKVYFPYSEISSILKKDSPISSLVNN